MKLIVLAGGQGTKLWPMSRERLPKQFQNIIGDKTLFRRNIEALLSSFSTDDIFISTKEGYRDLVIKDAPEIPEENFIYEPDIKKNQGPGTAYAAFKVAYRYPDEPFMVVQADCVRQPEEDFIRMIQAADKLVRRDKKLITGGIRPLYPDMGSDYLQLGERVGNDDDVDIYKIDKFIPRLNDYTKTKDLIESFHVSTHSNHHCWYADLLLEAFAQYKPNWYENFKKMRAVFGTKDEQSKTYELYSQLDEGPIEDVTKYIFESEGNVILLPFKWTDMGTWDSVYSYFDKGEKTDNYFDGDTISIDTESSLVKGKKGKIIATIGVENLVIVDTDDALLICDRDKTGDIKKILEELKSLKKEDYL